MLVAVTSAHRDFLLAQLRASGFDPEATVSPPTVLTALEDHAVSLVLLDAALPGMSGFEVCRQIRARSDVPVIFLTEQGALADRVRGFDCGADDYVVEPVEFIELERRIHAVLRRARPERRPEALEGPEGLVLRPHAHEAFVRGRRLDLTPKEFAILRTLLEGRAHVLSSDELSTSIWGYETFGSRNFVEAHISRLRAKLRAAGAGEVIETVRGVGYVIR
ncbi:MAG: response regulator transcription factor [Dehalococcoidia bacterium]